MRVRVPASSANLGPGYDTFGLALALHNTVEAELADEWRVEVRGEGAGQLSAGPDNQVAVAMARVFSEAGQDGRAADVVCHNGIPVGRGLGSSSAAIVAGLVLGDALCGARLGRDRLLQIAAELEGHADNVAAALHGGFTVVAVGPEGVICAPVEPAGGLAVIAVLGEHELPTAESRKALPAVVAHDAASGNAAHAALVALGIALGDARLTSAGLHDAIHESHREALVPDLPKVRTLFEAAGIGPVVLSGAGPSLVTLVHGTDDAAALETARRHAEDVRPLLDAIGRSRVLALGIDRSGAVLA